MFCSSQEWYSSCQEWLLTAGGRRLWELDMVWDKDDNGTQPSNHLKAFRFQVGLKNYRTPTDHTNSCKLMRDIAERFRQFNVTTFHEYYPFADQYLELKPALWNWNVELELHSGLAMHDVCLVCDDSQPS